MPLIIHMILIKKLDLYILRKFLLIFAGAFFVVLFVFMMQFTWRYVDDLIGKGLSIDILAKFYWYMAITLVRDSLPLAVLLSSLITFGNLGESFELLAMKAAGIPLFRIMRPLAIFAFGMTCTSFYFQNVASPKAQIELKTLLFSMKEQSPAVEIPEGVFNNGVPNINIYVQSKNTATGMLYQTIIYKTDQGFDHAQIVLADSARLEVTRDKQHLHLDLWNGEQFESLESSGGTQMMQNGANEPFDRETFNYKSLLIDFDSNFNMMDKNLLAGMPTAKNMLQIEHSVDSMNHELDSIGKQYYKDAIPVYYRRPQISTRDSVMMLRMLQNHIVQRGNAGSSANKTSSSTKKRSVSTQQEVGIPLQIDSVLSKASADRMQMARQTALSNAKSISADLEWKAMNTDQEERDIRNHWVEWHNKVTYSLACILFFFVGAPLGAIIRKGGLGLPTVISVAIFIVWYVIYISGMKMARDGKVDMVLGMWISSIVVAPFGVFFTYKANKDSVVFNMDAYRQFFSHLLGFRTHRHIFRKEVIIEEPRMDVVLSNLCRLKKLCTDYNKKTHLLIAPSYIRTFFRYTPDTAVEEINDLMENIVEELSNSKDRKVLVELNRFPIIYVHAHTTPFHNKSVNIAAGVLFPIGLVLWFRIWRFRLRLQRDLRVIVRTSDRLRSMLQGQVVGENLFDKASASQSNVSSFNEESAEANLNNTSLSENVRRFLTRRNLFIAALAAVALLAIGVYAHHAWRRYQYKRYVQEHGVMTPNTPEGTSTSVSIPFQGPINTQQAPKEPMQKQ